MLRSACIGSPAHASPAWCPQVWRLGPLGGEDASLGVGQEARRSVEAAVRHHEPAPSCETGQRSARGGRVYRVPSTVALIEASVDELHRRMVRRIKAAAKKRGMLLTHLPDRAAVSRSHFWDVLAGRKSPTLAWVSKIAAALEVDGSDLVSR